MSDEEFGLGRNAHRRFNSQWTNFPRSRRMGGGVINQLELSRSYSGARVFAHLLGRELRNRPRDGILAAAYKSRIPVYCPFVLAKPAVGRHHHPAEKKIPFNFDITMEMMIFPENTQLHHSRQRVRSNMVIWPHISHAPLRADTNTPFRLRPIRCRSRIRTPSFGGIHTRPSASFS